MAEKDKPLPDPTKTEIAFDPEQEVGAPPTDAKSLLPLPDPTKDETRIWERP